MEFQGGGQQQQPLLMRQNSLYSLSLDQVQTHLGKPLRSMNLEELLNSVGSAESNLESGGGTRATIDKAVGKRTVDQVWKDIQEEQAHGRQVITLGEMTLEDLLARAGAPIPMSAAHQQTVNVAMGGHGAGSPHVYEDDIQMLGRKRIAPGDVAEKTVERRQKRMIKNRESAARSRARKQAYTNELENKVSRLEEENERLKKRTEVEKMLRCAPPPEPKYQLRRTTSSPF